MRWDEPLFRWINRWPDGWNPMFQLFSEGNKWLWVRLILVAIVVGMLVGGRARGRGSILLALAAVPLANETTDLLKAWFRDPRPCVELVDAICRVEPLGSYGTASAHSANMAAVATVMAWQMGRWAIPWIALALLTGLSRVYVGVHYPQQVLIGWAVGILIGSAVVWTWRAASSRWSRSPEPPDEQPEIV